MFYYRFCVINDNISFRAAIVNELIILYVNVLMNIKDFNF